MKYIFKFLGAICRGLIMLILAICCIIGLLFYALWHFDIKTIFLDYFKFFLSEIFKKPLNCSIADDCASETIECGKCEHNGRNVPRGTMQLKNFVVYYNFIEDTGKKLCDSICIEAQTREAATMIFYEIEAPKIIKAKNIKNLIIKEIKLY